MTAKSDSDPRAPLRKRLGELRDQQAENKRSKQAFIDRLNALNNSLKKKVSLVSSFIIPPQTPFIDDF